MARSSTSSSSSSSSDDNQTKKRHALPSDKIDQPHDPHQSAAAAATTRTTANPTNAGPAVPMGYPPAIGYPPPYQPYPPNAHHPYNPYVQPPPPQPPYYPNQHYTYPPASTTMAGGGGSHVVRGFLVMIIALVLVSCAASIITWLVLRPHMPVFSVGSLAVSNFNLSRPDFVAEWDANVTVENPNHKLKIYFEQVQGFVFHEEDFLSSSAADPFLLLTKARETMAMKLRTNNTEQHSVGRWVVDEIVKERAGGAVSFNFRMLVLATFKSGSWWTRHASMKVFCEDLRVTFVGADTSGVFNGGNNPKECNVYYA